MRSLRATLIILFCLAAAMAAAQVMDPAHRNAGAVKPEERAATKAADCADCHSCAAPTHENPCLQSCRRHGAQFQGKHTTDEGPEVVIIDQLANLYGPVVFAHQLHARMSTMNGACTNCHHYSPATGKVPPCRDCHEPTRDTVDLRQPALKGAYHRQCINCHLDWSHENACEFCHKQAGGSGTGAGAGAGTPATGAHDPTDIVGTRHPLIKATPTYTFQTTEKTGPVVTFHHEDHVQKFGLQCVDCHRGDSCRSCHDMGGAKEKRQLNHVTTCGVCHAERNCAFCHSAATKPTFDHKISTGWSLEPFHRKVACQTCHGEPQDFRKPDRNCTSCHIHWAVGSFDHAVTGVKLNDEHRELDCDNCHLDMKFAVTPSCVNCHDEPMLPAKLPGTRVKRR